MTNFAIVSNFIFYAAITSGLFVGRTIPATTTTQTRAYIAPSYCQHSSLTGIDFMNLAHAIIAHGDLTDITFIEHTFGAKLSSSYDDATSGSRRSESSLYSTDQILGNPVHADLFINYSKERQLKYKLIARMSIGSQTSSGRTPAFLQSCLHISASEFSSYFGGKFLYLNPFPDQQFGRSIHPPNNFSLPNTNALQQLANPGKSHSKIYLRYSFNTEDNVVFSIGIFQQP